MPGTSLREIRLPGLQGVPPVLAAPGSEWHFCTGSLLCLDIIVLFRSHLYVASPPEAGRKENLLPHHTHTQPRDNPVPAIVASFSSRQGPDNACPILVIAVGSHAPRTRTSVYPVPHAPFTLNRETVHPIFPCSLVSNQTSIFYLPLTFAPRLLLFLF